MTAFRMVKRLSAVAGAIGIAGAAFSGCGGGGNSPIGPPGGGGSTNELTKAGAQQNSTTGSYTGPGGLPYSSRSACELKSGSSGAAWTILVYMQAANNLQPESLLNVGQLASVGGNSSVNVVLQWKQIPAAQTNSCPNCAPSFIGVRRYLLRQHSAADVQAIESGNTNPLQSDRLPDPPGNTPVNTSGAPDTNPDPNGKPNGTEDMGDWHNLKDFVDWGSTTYPARNLMVVIWDHGSGWVDAYRSVVRNSNNRSRAAMRQAFQKSRAVCQDDSTNNEIETWELPSGLSGTAQPIDILAIDCSLEQMTEVAYELRNSARIVNGSEESPPGPGYPYDKWLAALEQNVATQTNCDVGNDIIQNFINDPSYISDASYRLDLTQSMIDLSQMGSVASALNQLGSVLYNHVQSEATALATARNAAQNYDPSAGYGDNKDLFDYCQQLQVTPGISSDIQQAAANVQKALIGPSGAVLEWAHGPASENGSFGLAIWVPTPNGFSLDGSVYSNLALATAAPNWVQFLGSQTQ